MELISPYYDRTKVISKDFPFDAFFFMNENFIETAVNVQTYDNLKQMMKNYEFRITKEHIYPINEGFN